MGGKAGIMSYSSRMSRTRDGQFSHLLQGKCLMRIKKVRECWHEARARNDHEWAAIKIVPDHGFRSEADESYWLLPSNDEPIHSHHTLAFALDDQRIDFRFGNAVDVGQLRKRANGLR